MVPTSENDLVSQINDIYFKLKNTNHGTKTAILFEKAVTDVFNQWGEYFGFKSISELKSLYGKSRKKKKSVQDKPCTQPAKEDLFEYGDPLLEQIKRLNLNPDSYF